MMANAPKFWGTLVPLPAPIIASQCEGFESRGLEGVFAPQVGGTPFAVLGAAAASSQKLRLATGIALAFARSPYETALHAIDLDRLSGGRFTLGLGTSVRSWSEGFYGMPYGQPLDHLREVIEIVRMIIDKGHTGELTSYDGKYWSLDFRELQPTSAPLRNRIPIWIAGLRSPLIRLGAEIADGVLGHPIWSIEWASKHVMDEMKTGLARGGKERAQVEFNAWLFVAPNPDRRQAIEDARATVAFYGGIAQYEEYFASHGFRAEARALQEGVKRADYLSVKHLVTDEWRRPLSCVGHRTKFANG
jgi:alkanesulfonate monooxygenase SsuD/methylene tetrahydromethanopterin reductase-like flavin-dependent oxidoreductase (luciferase family)